MGIGTLSGNAGARRAVFLDRDGVINALCYDPEHGLIDSPANPDQFALLPGVGKAIREINASGLLAIVVSNQPGIAKGKCSAELLAEIDRKMAVELDREGAKLDDVLYCLHHPAAVVEGYRASCDCRKPRPGLLKRAAERFGIDLASSYMVGDGLTDVQAGAAAGCRTVLLGPQKCYVCRHIDELDLRPDVLAADLPEAVRVIMTNQSSRGTVDIDPPIG